MRDNFDYFVEYYTEMAKQDKARYDAYINEGFNEQQALYLVKRE